MNDQVGTPLAALDLESSPYQRFLGLQWVSIDRGVVEVLLPFRQEFLRADGSDWLHGGVLSALADIAGDYAIATILGRGVPTIDLRVDYLAPAHRGAIHAVARAVKVGRTVAVADIEIKDPGGRLIAVGRGAYAVQNGRPAAQPKC